MSSGTVPVHALAPLEYRYALDAATTLLAPAPAGSVRVCCNVPHLEGEIQQRLVPSRGEQGYAALWVEPLAGSWIRQLRLLARSVPDGGTLVIILSLPLARGLPERRSWSGHPVGMNPRLIWALYRALRGAGFEAKGLYGFHSLAAIVLSLFSQVADRRDRADLADRLRFAGRLQYATSGMLVPFSTVALVAATKRSSRRPG